MFEAVDLILEIESENILGEGIQWHAPTNSVWWTDIVGAKLCVLDWETKKLCKIDMPEPVGSFAFTTNPEILLVAFATGFAFYNLTTTDITSLNQPIFLSGEGRFNDGRVDRHGRFFAGTMMADPFGPDTPTGRLFSYGLDGMVKEHIQGLRITNGLCWSPDGKILYHTDTPTRIIDQYDYDSQTGALSNKRDFAKTPKGGGPDGAAIDADGNMWCAHWGTGQVLVFNPMGQMIGALQTPVTQVSCVAFGGPKLDMLLVTSARQGMSQSQLAAEPSAGNMFVYQTIQKGLLENIYLGTLV